MKIRYIKFRVLDSHGMDGTIVKQCCFHDGCLRWWDGMFIYWGGPLYLLFHLISFYLFIFSHIEAEVNWSIFCGFSNWSSSRRQKFCFKSYFSEIFSQSFLNKTGTDNGLRRAGDKLLSATMAVMLLTHICITRPQWVYCRYILPP